MISFVSFIDQLKMLLAEPLPGRDAQLMMAPKTRIPELLNPDILHSKQSSVMMVIFPKKEIPHLLLIKRNTYDGIHSGQMAFPGGHFEERDLNLTQTAIRETFEETNIKISKTDIIGELTPLYIAPSKFYVKPFIANLNQKPNYKKNEKEVSEIVEIDLFAFLSNPLIEEEEFVVKNNYAIVAPFYNMNNHKVWGATAMMLSEFVAIAKDIKKI